MPLAAARQFSFFFAAIALDTAAPAAFAAGRRGRNAGSQLGDQVRQAFQIVEPGDPHQRQFGQRAALRAESQAATAFAR